MAPWGSMFASFSSSIMYPRVIVESLVQWMPLVAVLPFFVCVCHSQKTSPGEGSALGPQLVCPICAPSTASKAGALSSWYYAFAWSGSAKRILTPHAFFDDVKSVLSFVVISKQPSFATQHFAAGFLAAHER